MPRPHRPPPPAQDADPGAATPPAEASAATPIEDTASAAAPLQIVDPIAAEAAPAAQTQLVAVTASAVAGFNPDRLADLNISEEMAMAVSEATVLGDLDKRLRDRIHKRVNRMTEKCELPQALAAEWSVAKADRTGAKQLSFMKLWLQNNGTFGGATVSETASAGKDTLNRFVMGWKTKAQIRAEYSGSPSAEEIVEREIKGAKSIPHPLDKKDKERRLYYVVVRVEEETVGVKSNRQNICVSASADVEAVGFAESVHDKIERENCLITRGKASADWKKNRRALVQQDSAASAASDQAPPEKKVRTQTPATAAGKMRTMINKNTTKLKELCRRGTALAVQSAAVEDYIKRIETCKATNDRLLQEKCDKASLPTDPEALASAINEVAVGLRAHTGVMNSFKSFLLPEQG